MMTFKDISDVYRFLGQLPSFQMHGAVAARLGLDRIRKFCSHLGNPQDKVPCIHVAGTNGKGSVSVMLSLVYQNAGYRTGLYTSPHLNHISERFRINGVPISEEALLRFFQEHGEDLQRTELSYFEITTVIAFWWFAEEKVDIAILETGLGGRLDATNIVKPEVSVITSIGFDHSNFLGNTMAEIAGEKAGIIKKNRPVVIGNMRPAAREKIVHTAKKQGAEVLDARTLRPRYRRGRGKAAGLIHFWEDGRRSEVRTDILVPVHRWNVAIARLVIRKAGDMFPVSLPEFCEALQSVYGSGLLPGRFERLAAELPWYFDGAHNPEAVKALTETIKRQEWATPPVMVLCIMEDKAQKKMLEPFSVFQKNYYYVLKSERAADFAQIAPFLSNIQNLPPCEEEIIDFFRGLTKQVVIFTGSFYFYGVVKRWISRIIKAE